ncbi:uncharacterized protein LOC134177275 isoform X2 [Corticium candelabrum]|uniref:uncharacterized protein LOC134177275 isoform X2 n=1 Tax=Corticium candelabrum TaxID=121492 RepID=UPI002E26561B|nr:uncharacterized protein LOC134177275 isoform X2 [Corticium candelabrum]
MSQSSGTSSCDTSPWSDESGIPCVVCNKELYSCCTCGLGRAKSGKICTFCRHVVCSTKGCSTKVKRLQGRHSSGRSCSYCRDFFLSPSNDGEMMVEGTFDKREGRHNEITNPYRVCMTRDKMKPEATVHWQMQAAQTENYSNSLEGYGKFLLISNVDSILFKKHAGTSEEEKFSVTFKLSGDDDRIVSYIFETQDEELFQRWQRALKSAYHVIKRRLADDTTPLIQGSSAYEGHDIQ